MPSAVRHLMLSPPASRTFDDSPVHQRARATHHTRVATTLQLATRGSPHRRPHKRVRMTSSRDEKAVR